MTETLRPLLRDALGALGIRRLLLGVHDAAFPVSPAEDVGRGSPYADGAPALLELAAALGFDGLQLGPQGATSRSDPSPYDGTLFSRNPRSIALAPLVRAEWGALLREETLAAAVAGRPGPPDLVSYEHAFDAIDGALREAAARFREKRARGEGGPVAELAVRLARFREEHAGWLERDALYEVLEQEHGGASWREWDARDVTLLAPPPGGEEAAAARRSALLARHADRLEDYAFVQLLAHEQHRLLRERAHRLGLALFGDLQIGMSERDAWATQALVLRDWRMGAPPSRTDPGGQAWGFRVLDPDRYLEATDGGAPRDGPVLRFVRARALKTFAEYDGLRIDHPHGLVCPWVYRSSGDPAAAVREGARLFDSPDEPELARWAISRPEQLDRGVPRHADGRVVALEPGQVARYAVLFDAIVGCARDPRDLACEILSTQPYPLRQVIARHRLGRFRVTQKAELARPDDVYRGENAEPEDWIMLGNHDTRTIRTIAEGWVATGEGRAQAEYLATRLLAAGEDREAWIRRVASDPGALAQARFADLFVGPARHVMVFFSDLLGDRRRYNTPGTFSERNWAIRLAPGFAAGYAARCAEGKALDVPRALARAIRARGGDFASGHRELVAALERGGPLTPARSPSQWT
jgi:4-alpha-glucanotransferase